MIRKAEKNLEAIKFYEKHGFHDSGDRQLEEGTTEYLIRMDASKERDCFSNFLLHKKEGTDLSGSNMTTLVYFWR